ncbi:MAG: ATP-binding cassette domain-containing protein [Acidimicrobiales bacterium]
MSDVTAGGSTLDAGVLEVIDARAGYGPVEAVHGVSLRIMPGSVVALLGRNGAGKSTLLRAIAGVVPLTSGSIRFGGRDLTHYTTFQRADAGIALVPDEANMFGGMSVAENLAVFGGGAPIEPALRVFPELERLMERRAGTLSGGERQMVALSRVLVKPSPVVLLDEVSRGLSPAATARMSDAIWGLSGPERVVVIVEQFLHDVLRLADTVYVLRRGEISFAGEPAELSAAYAGSYD